MRHLVILLSLICVLSCTSRKEYLGLSFGKKYESIEVAKILKEKTNGVTTSLDAYVSCVGEFDFGGYTFGGVSVFLTKSGYIKTILMSWEGEKTTCEFLCDNCNKDLFKKYSMVSRGGDKYYKTFDEAILISAFCDDMFAQIDKMINGGDNDNSAFYLQYEDPYATGLPSNEL